MRVINLTNTLLRGNLEAYSNIAAFTFCNQMQCNKIIFLHWFIGQEAGTAVFQVQNWEVVEIFLVNTYF